MSSAMTIEEKDLDSLEKRQKFTVSIIGCTRNALSLAYLLAEAGFKTILADKNHSIINYLKNDTAPFLEPEFNALLKKHTKNGCLTFTNDIKEASSRSDVILFFIQTLIDRKKKPDYSHIEKACKEVGTSMHKRCLIIIASTIGVGLTERLIKEKLENASGMRAGVDFALAYSPVHISSGSSFKDLAAASQFVSAVNEQSLRSACAILNTAIKAEMVEIGSLKTAEVVDLFEDAFQDVNIALANEFAQFCERAGIDFIEIQNIANRYSNCQLPTPRITKENVAKAFFLLLEEAAMADAKLPLLTLARKVNDEMLSHTLHLIIDGLRACNRAVRRARVSILGVSSHANMKEIHGSATRKLVDLLKRKGIFVRVYDPLFSYKELLNKGYPAERTLKETIEQTDCLVITVGHDQFKQLNLKRIKLLARKSAAIVDMGYVIDPIKAVREGFIYRGLGRGIPTK
jgi:UDP-N-acetyl-D-mannosaminuronic acid dehydrogenase